MYKLHLNVGGRRLPFVYKYTSPYSVWLALSLLECQAIFAYYHAMTSSNIDGFTGCSSFASNS